MDNVPVHLLWSSRSLVAAYFSPCPLYLASKSNKNHFRALCETYTKLMRRFCGPRLIHWSGVPPAARGVLIRVTGPTSSDYLYLVLYSTGHLFIVTNGNTDLGWVSYCTCLCKRVRFTFTSEQRVSHLSCSRKYQPTFLITLFISTTTVK